MNFIKILALFFLVQTLCQTALARNPEESAVLLQQAMMQSNADYNKHKLVDNMETFDRADEWTERGTEVIQINNRGLDPAELAEYQKVRDDFQIDEQEVTALED